MARSAVAAEAERPAERRAVAFHRLSGGAAKPAASTARPMPEITRPAPAIILSDAKGGAAHPGFDPPSTLIVEAAKRIRRRRCSRRRTPITCGALGYFAGRLAERGAGGDRRHQRAGAACRLRLDQAGLLHQPDGLRGAGGRRRRRWSSTSRRAPPPSSTSAPRPRPAQPIPAGWALDAEGRPTTDAGRGHQGRAACLRRRARRQHRADGRGACGRAVSGANWSLDAPSFTRGAESPGTGLTVIALAPKLVDPGFETRLATQLDRLVRRMASTFPAAPKAPPAPWRRPRACRSRAPSTSGSPGCEADPGAAQTTHEKPPSWPS